MDIKLLATKEIEVVPGENAEVILKGAVFVVNEGRVSCMSLCFIRDLPMGALPIYDSDFSFVEQLEEVWNCPDRLVNILSYLVNQLETSKRAKEYDPYSVGFRGGLVKSINTIIDDILLERHRISRDDKHAQLLMAVQRKFPGETRQETALRHIREAEAKAEAAQTEG